MTSKLNSNHDLGSFTIDTGNSDLPLALASCSWQNRYQAVW